jgi:hypothetical protein
MLNGAQQNEVEWSAVKHLSLTREACPEARRGFRPGAEEILRWRYLETEILSF